MKQVWNKEIINAAIRILGQCSTLSEAAALLSREIGYSVTAEGLSCAFLRRGLHASDYLPSAAQADARSRAGRAAAVARHGRAERIRVTPNPPTPARVAQAIRGGARTYDQISAAVGCDAADAKRLAGDAAELGYQFRAGPEYVQPFREAAPESPTTIETDCPSADGWTMLGLISDTHIGSAEAATAELGAWLRFIHGLGCRHVIHAGDLLDGTYWFRGAFLEQVQIGLDRQISESLNALPHLSGLTYWILAGNHDTNGYWRQAGIDPIAAFVHRARADGRTDIRHLGTTVGRLAIGSDDRTCIRVEAAHIEKGSGAYARSYPVEKYAESIAGGSKPDLLVLGHLHRHLTAWIRGIWCCMPGCWQWQTEFERRKARDPAVGGVLVWARRSPYRLDVVHQWHGLHAKEVAWQRSD